MLFIGDIHIHPRIGERCIQQLDTYIQDHADDRDIIFLGDYVYSFTYHKKELIDLLHRWMKLVHQGKNLYILAGNHDRLGSHFVYTEAQTIIQGLYTHQSTTGSIHFITQPERHVIQGQTMFFVPYMLGIDSISLNASIQGQLADKSNQNITIVHHYYTANCTLSGLTGTFSSTRNVCLDASWLNQPHIKVISGHIHHASTLHNYLCTGAIWNTHQAEYNTPTYLRQRDIVKKTMIATPIYISLVCCIDDTTITQANTQTIATHRQHIYTTYRQYIGSWGEIPIIYDERYTSDSLAYLTCLIDTNTLTYDTLNTYIDDTTTKGLDRVMIQKKKNTVALDKLTSMIAQKDMVGQASTSGLSDWKNLLYEYIQTKYDDKSPLYTQALQDIGL